MDKKVNLPEAFYVVRVVPGASGKGLGYREKGGKHYVQLYFAAQHAASVRRSGHVVQLWESRVDEIGWTELDLDKVLESLT